jgi:hypothetical protein
MTSMNHHAALIYTMVLMAASDRNMSDAEMSSIGDMVGHLPVFRDYDRERIAKTAASCVDLLSGEGGLDKKSARRCRKSCAKPPMPWPAMSPPPTARSPRKRRDFWK